MGIRKLKPVLCLGYFMLLAVAQPIAATTATPTITNFAAHDRLDRAGQLDVAETFTFDPGPTRPATITQNLPIAYADDQGNPLISKFTLISATRDGHPLTLQPAANASVVKLDFPLSSDSSPQIFALHYTLTPVILAASSADIFKFSATGLGWSVPIMHITITLDLPGLKPQNLTCYSGSQGSTSSDCRLSEAGSQTTLTTDSPLQPGDTLNVAAGFPRHSFSNYYNSNRVWITQVVIIGVILVVITTSGWLLTQYLYQRMRPPHSPTA